MVCTVVGVVVTTVCTGSVTSSVVVVTGAAVVTSGSSVGSSGGEMMISTVSSDVPPASPVTSVGSVIPSPRKLYVLCTILLDSDSGAISIRSTVISPELVSSGTRKSSVP